MTNLKCNLKKILSFVLAIVMLIGVVPAVFKFNADVKAETPADSLETGFVQGANDAVIFMVSPTTEYMYYYDTVIGEKFAGNLVDGKGVHNGTDYTTQPFERLIFVFTNLHDYGNSAATMHLKGFEPDAEVVWTSKCTVTNPANVWTFTHGGRDGKDDVNCITLAVDSSAKADTYNYLDGETTGGISIWTRASSEARLLNNYATHLYCNMTWDYLNVQTMRPDGTTQAKHPAIDARGYNFKVGEHVSFNYGTEANDASCLSVINSQFKSGADSVQTIEILSGKWVVISPYPATLDCNETLNGTVNVTIGSAENGAEPITVVSSAAGVLDEMLDNLSVFANASMADTAVINYTVNNAIFDSELYVFGGRYLSAADSATAPTVEGTINLSINGATFNAGIAAHASTGETLLKTVANADNTGLRVNVTANSVSLAEGKTISLSPVDIVGDNADYVTTTVYAHTSIHDFITADNVHSLTAKDCTHNLVGVAKNEDGNRVITLNCSNTGCGFSRTFAADAQGRPVIYLDNVTGSDSYYGDSIAHAVKTFTRANALLEKWGLGGTIVLVDDLTVDLNGAILTNGEPTTITADTTTFLGDNGRRFGADKSLASILYLDSFVFHCYADTTFENLCIALPNTNGYWYLHYNDITINDTVAFYDYSAHVDSRPTVDKSNSTYQNINLFTGSPTAGHVDNFGTQKLVFDAGVFNVLNIGNKVYNKEEEYGASVGTVDVYLGNASKITAINADPFVSDITTNFTFEKDVLFTYGATGDGVDITVEDIADMLNRVTVVDGDLFTSLTESLKYEEETGKVSVRVTATANETEIDALTNNSVKEFGFLFVKGDGNDVVNYFEHIEGEDWKSNLVGKSVCYDGTRLNYDYDVDPEEEAHLNFKGILEFDQLDAEDKIRYAYDDFIAYPYALYDGDNYLTIGAGKAFTLKNVLDDILNGDNDADKETANTVLALIADEPAFPVVGEDFVPVVPEDPETEPDSEPVTDPVGSIAYFDAARLPDGFALAASGSLENPDCTGITKLATGARTTATLYSDNDLDYVRFNSTSDSGTKAFDFYVDDEVFTGTGERTYYFVLTFRLNEGYSFNDSNDRALFVRPQPDGSKYDVTVLTGENVSANGYTDWETITFELTIPSDPTYFRFYTYALSNNYIDIQSIAIYDKDPSTTEPETEPVTDPVGSIAYFDAARLPDGFTGTADNSGCTGIETLSLNARATAAVDTDEDGTEYLQLTKTTETSYATFTMSLDSEVFTGGNTYHFFITFRLSEGFASINEKALFVRFKDDNNNDHIFVADTDLTQKTFTEWTTLDFTITTDAAPTELLLITYATKDSYIDLKSIAIYDYEILEAPLDAIGFFNPSKMTEDVSGFSGDQQQIAIADSEGIASIQGYAGSATARTGMGAELVTENGVKFFRLLNKDTHPGNTYSWLQLNLDTADFTTAGTYYLTLNFRLNDGYNCTDTTEKDRAIFVRPSSGSDVTVLSGTNLTENPHTGWTTLTISVKTTSAPTYFRIIIYAGAGDYIDIKSLSIVPEVANSAEYEALSYQQQFEPDENSSSTGSVGTFNYCPSIIIDDDGYAYMYYCTNSGFQEEPILGFQRAGVEDHIGCRKGTPDGNGGYTWGAETLVLSPSSSGWDSQNVCDPSVIKGNFSYNGETYTYLMAYLGAANSNNVENETGLAVSNDPMSGWVKVGTTPFIDAPTYDSSLTYNQWGEGQPSLVSIDKAGKAYIFWTYGVGEGVNEIHFMECDFSDLSNIVKSDVKVLTAKGLVKYNGAVDYEINNVDFMYDSDNDVFYMVGESHPWTSAIPSLVSQYFRIAYISADELEDGTWTMIGNFKDSDETFTRSHNAGFLRDQYGHLPANAEFIGVYYTVAYAPDGASEHNDTLCTYRIHNYFRVIPEALRATVAE